MCGHATIAVARWAVESGRVARVAGPAGEETPVVIQCPCGLVRAFVAQDGAARFESVPSFAVALDREVTLPDGSRAVLDVSFGGAFYAVVPASRLGVDLDTTPVAQLVDKAHAVTTAAQAQLAVRHPFEADLSFLYGTIITDGGSGAERRRSCARAGRRLGLAPPASAQRARTSASSPTARWTAPPRAAACRRGSRWRLHGRGETPFGRQGTGPLPGGARHQAVTASVAAGFRAGSSR
jgi:trans-L-3-hydroxyproline dehydratase